MKLKLISEYDIRGQEPMVTQSSRHEAIKTYFYELPEMVQHVSDIEIGYDNILEIQDLGDVFVVKDKEGNETAYNADGSHWNAEDDL